MNMRAESERLRHESDLTFAFSDVLSDSNRCCCYHTRLQQAPSHCFCSSPCCTCEATATAHTQPSSPTHAEFVGAVHVQTPGSLMRPAPNLSACNEAMCMRFPEAVRKQAPASQSDPSRPGTHAGAAAGERQAAAAIGGHGGGAHRRHRRRFRGGGVPPHRRAHGLLHLPTAGWCLVRGLALRGKIFFSDVIVAEECPRFAKLIGWHTFQLQVCGLLKELHTEEHSGCR